MNRLPKWKPLAPWPRPLQQTATTALHEQTKGRRRWGGSERKRGIGVKYRAQIRGDVDSRRCSSRVSGMLFILSLIFFVNLQIAYFLQPASIIPNTTPVATSPPWSYPSTTTSVAQRIGLKTRRALVCFFNGLLRTITVTTTIQPHNGMKWVPRRFFFSSYSFPSTSIFRCNWIIATETPLSLANACLETAGTSPSPSYSQKRWGYAPTAKRQPPLLPRTTRNKKKPERPYLQV